MLKETLGPLLPTFTKKEKDMIKGSCDFYAIDGYTAFFGMELEGGSAACAANSSDPSFPECAGSTQLDPSGFPIGPQADAGVSWLTSTPKAMRAFLNVLTKELFPSAPDIVVSEFGFAEPDEGLSSNLGSILWDLRRADYMQSTLDNILAAKVQDGKMFSNQPIQSWQKLTILQE